MEEDSSDSFVSRHPEPPDQLQMWTCHRAICDVCDYSIFGLRFKCTVCSDYDMCEDCYHVWQKDAGNSETCNLVHPHGHLFLKVRVPLPPPGQRPAVCAPEFASTHGPVADCVHRNVLCDGCNLPVVGLRFRCINCDGFDLCVACEARLPSTDVHPELHVFAVVPFVVRAAQLRCLSSLSLMYPASFQRSLLSSSAEDRLPAPTAPSSPAASDKRCTNAEIRVRPMRVEDLDAVCAIEDLSFASPYPMSHFVSLLHSSKTGCAVAVNLLDEPVGYVICNLKKTRAAQMSSIAILPDYRGFGIGHLLVKQALTQATEWGCPAVVLHVNVTNRAAQKLYQKFGFTVVDWLKGYYSDENQDAVTMRLSL
eukprot:TRINITY_DN28533_c0_g1_i1.p1 TRINITY_DN28533_c0_g1~~TRINITY_DN28533_c0_g1_i1.p1  ORF type:complete len:366 (-),score=8.94 TRINITY_DN28533_c0_g1_i1:223-1320(-)